MSSQHNIALVGLTNVGKSTLFNKLVEKNKALTSEQPNTTRDRNYGIAVWRGSLFRMIDTGGLDAFDFVDQEISEETIEKQILDQTKKSLAEADLIFFVTDGRRDIARQEKELARLVKKQKKPVILICNKIDSTNIENNLDMNQFWQLNLGKPRCVSAKSGRGTGDLLDAAYDLLKNVKKSVSRKVKLAEQLTTIKLALIGKPNAGKSSLVNAILDRQQAIVSPVPHTTREPQEIDFYYKQQPWQIIDTAGIRKRATSGEHLEQFGVTRSLESLKAADIVFLVIDVSKALSVQDSYLANEIKTTGCGLIIVANKWDLITDKSTNTINDYQEMFYHSFPFLHWAPVMFVSALTKMRVKNLLDLATEVNSEKRKVVDPKELKVFTKKFIEYFKPVRAGGKLKPRIKSFTQTASNPPAFTVELYAGADLHESYLRYIENQVRRAFGFVGVPIRIGIKKQKKVHSAPNQKAPSNKTGGSTRPKGIKRR